MKNKRRFPGNEIHPTALIAEGVRMGTGNYIGPYCVIGFPAEWKGKEDKSGNVHIGNNNRLTGLVTIDSGVESPTMIFNGCYLMKHSHVGHDAGLCDNVTLSCGAKVGGHATVCNGANVGLNAVIHQKQIIKHGCMIGMGAVVTKKLITEPFRKYAGNPARDIGPNDCHPEYTINMKETL